MFNLRLEKRTESFLFDTDSFQNSFQCKFSLKVWHPKIRYCGFRAGRTKVVDEQQTVIAATVFM